MNPKTRTPSLIPVAVALVLAAGTVGCGRKNDGGAAATAAAATATAPPSSGTAAVSEVLAPREVELVAAARRDFRPTIEATGTLRASREAELRALSEGQLEAVPVDVGTRVGAGQTVFQVRPTEYRLDLQQAEAAVVSAQVALKDARRERDRMEGLAREGSATGQMLDQAVSAAERAEAALGEAQARRDAARQRLSDTTGAAPYGGVITARMLQRGEFVARGNPVVKVADLSTLHGEFEVPERLAGTLAPGMKADLVVRTTGDALVGTIVAVNPAIESTNRTFLVKVAVPNPDLRLQAGLFATARFELPPRLGALAVPVAAVIRDEGRSFVWIVDDGRARTLAIREGLVDGDWVEVVEGVGPGQRVVTTGAGGLVAGAQVAVKGS
ncbi:MAG: efflux RND transporter periplasmic adaptor subunit [Acidobacteria bacterium]|jgi:membrane fusion protein (multidrug efflux system)|nr:efflux RND transporter periplasmic adaptor subunit [Acidobacteriota bacterium]